MGLFSKVKKAVKSVVKGAGKVVKTVAAPVAAVAGLNWLGSNQTVQSALSSLGLGGLFGSGETNSSILGSLLGNLSGGNLIGSYLNYEAQKKQLEQARDQAKLNNQALEKQWEFAQKQLANQNSLASKNMAMQKVFAQNGIRWRVEDAKAAGLHPLIGAGSSNATYSPVASVGVGTPEGAPSAAPSSSGALLSALGQGIERAINAGEVQKEREYQERLRNYELMSRELDNEERVSRIGLNQARIKEIERVGAITQGRVSKGVPLMYRKGAQMLPGQQDAVERFVNDVTPSEVEAQKWSNMWGLIDVPMTLYRAAKRAGTSTGSWVARNKRGYNKKYGNRSTSTGSSYWDSFNNAHMY